MASSLLALLDDITTVLDDVALLSKMAAKKTAGVLGDDLALNAQQVTGVNADRELPVVWGVAKGSLINKAILVPAALVISAFAPWAVTPLLMVGGAYLCFEGFEKLAHKWLHTAEDDAHATALSEAVANPDVDLAALEKDKVKGAIRTDFILSAEIIAITLGTVADATFSHAGAGAVGHRPGDDDRRVRPGRRHRQAGRRGPVAEPQGRGLAAGAGPRPLLCLAPWLMKALSVVGTAAMFLVGGGILTHGAPFLHHAIQHVVETLGVGGFAKTVVELLGDAITGILAGIVVVAAVTGIQRLRHRRE